MKMLTPYEVAEALQVSYDTVLGLIKKGELPCIKIGRQYRVSEKALNEFIVGATVAPVNSTFKNIYSNSNKNKISLRRAI